MLMWVGWGGVDATSTPFTVTMFWVILPVGEKTYTKEFLETRLGDKEHTALQKGKERKTSLYQDPRGLPRAGIDVTVTLTWAATSRGLHHTYSWAPPLNGLRHLIWVLGWMKESVLLFQ